jgi:predicted ATPase
VQAGSGVVEVLFLLTLSHGLINSVILLDEPAVNLHTPLLKSVMNEITKPAEVPEHKNQVIIITHSFELLHYLLFEKESKVPVYLCFTDTWYFIAY